MNKPKGYDESRAFTGETESLPLGGHVCVILDAREEIARTGSAMLVVSFDIAHGEPNEGFFKNLYESLKQQYSDAKWPNGGVYRQFTTKKDGTCNEWFKGMITAIEESNSGFHFNFDEKTLKGKLFGGVFGREEYEDQNGNRKWATKCFQIRSVEAIRKGVKVPEDKPLKNSGSNSSPSSNRDFEEIEPEDDLPF